MDLAPSLAVEVLGAEVARGLELHVALVAIRLGDFGVVEAASPVAGDTGQEVGVVVVLAADEILVVGDADRQADLVAGRAELGVACRIGLKNVFLCISGLAFTSELLIHCKNGSSLKAKG